jgi:hypothetical protein
MVSGMRLRMLPKREAKSRHPKCTAGIRWREILERTEAFLYLRELKAKFGALVTVISSN